MRTRAGQFTVLTAVYGLIYLIWERAGWGGPEWRDLISNVAFMPLNLAVITLNALAARNASLDPGVRRGLRIMSVGSAAVLGGNIISVSYLMAGESPVVSWADALYLADTFLILAALLSFPLARHTRSERWKFVLDAAMVVIGGAVAIWYFTVLPTAGSSHGSVTMTVIAFAYPLASLLLLFGVTTVLLGRPLDGNRLAFSLLVAGTLISIVADLAFDLSLLELGSRTATLVDAIYLLCYLFLIASAELYYRRPVATEPRRGALRHRLQPFSPLPYLAVAGTFSLLLATVLVPWTEPVSGIAVSAVVLTILVVSRQFLAVRENVRLLAENAARQNEARFRSLVQHSSDVMIVVRPDSTIQFVSPSVTRVLRYEIEPLMGRPLIDLLQPEDREHARTFFRDAARTPGVTSPVEWRFRQPDGSSLHAEVIATNLLHESTVRGLVLNIRDVSERKRLEKQLTHQAFHDPLTGLANRALFRDRVSHGLALARRDGRLLSVLFLDLDDFKKVNDSLGHHEGDRLLVAAAERFETCARNADTVARLGGDEFAILIENVAETDGPQGLAQRLTAVMLKPFLLSGNEVQINASIGIATSTGSEDADDLLRNADVAMYTAKRHGKGRSEVYQSQMYSEIRERLELEAALRHAIEQRELTLVYQPIVSLKNGRIFGVEALVRWDHPKLGPLVPLQFIPLAEETGLIVPLGRWVLREACAQMRRWRTAFPALPLSVAVNLSGRQLHELDVVDETRAALAESGVDPSALVLEITESVLMQQAGSVRARLEQLKELGVSLSIDDFGIGYSSLSYLQRFPIDILKIAKPFVDDVGLGEDRAALARAIVGLGDTLHLHTIAEGIETAEQCAALIALGCAYGQGYHFSPPLPPEGIEALLGAAAPGPPATGVWS